MSHYVMKTEASGEASTAYSRHLQYVVNVNVKIYERANGSQARFTQEDNFIFIYDSSP